LLEANLTGSFVAIAQLLAQAFESGRVKGFKPHPAALPGYIISHESHHHGEIEMTLSQSGHKLDQKISFGLSEWRVR